MLCSLVPFSTLHFIIHCFLIQPSWRAVCFLGCVSFWFPRVPSVAGTKWPVTTKLLSPVFVVVFVFAFAFVFVFAFAFPSPSRSPSPFLLSFSFPLSQQVPAETPLPSSNTQLGSHPPTSIILWVAVASSKVRKKSKIICDVAWDGFEPGSATKPWSTKLIQTSCKCNRMPGLPNLARKIRTTISHRSESDLCEIRF